ncbi:hypothetical protein MK079_04230, partial [Candidatus Gracilibacteria bacterium]|nr:hypothetical protein [Candidatus Gracilibacteria bacterium]
DGIFASFDDENKIPCESEVIQKWGSWEAWQEEMCQSWINKKLGEISEDQMLILDMQTNIDFVLKALNTKDNIISKILLVTCGLDEMKKRLQKRGQPDLYNQDMVNWIQFLEKQANEKGIHIVNTQGVDVKYSVEDVKKEIYSL